MKWKESTPFELPPVGSHIARCYMVIDLGTHQHSFQGDVWSQRDVRIGFELPTEKMTGKYNQESKGRVFSVNLNTKQSLHQKAKLRQLLEGWRGRAFTKDELAGFDPSKLVEAPCRISLVASQNGDFVNINSISPLGKGEKCPKQVNDGVFLSLNPEEFNAGVFNALNDKTKEKISSSPEWQALKHAESGGDPQSEPGDNDGAPIDEDIPF